MSLLTLVQGACDLMSLVRPSAVISSTDQQVRNLLGLAQLEGYELARRGTWQALTSEKTFTTLAQASQTSAIPTDFGWYINGTMYNRTQRRRFSEPLSSEEWQRIQASLVTLVNPGFRIRGSAILITPTPSAGDTVAYEYVTKNWCTSAMSVAQSAWALDTDTAVLDEELHILGVIWRHRKTKGLDYAEDFRTYEIAVANALQRDGAKPRIQTGVVDTDRMPNPPQMPDTLTGLS